MPTVPTTTTSIASKFGRWVSRRSSPGAAPNTGSVLGQYRWVVEQTFALLHWFRRLRIRWEIRDDIHEAFLRLACASICLRRLTSLSPY